METYTKPSRLVAVELPATTSSPKPLTADWIITLEIEKSVP